MHGPPIVDSISRVMRNPDVLWRATFDRFVLLPPTSDHPLYLMGTAAVLWDLLDEPLERSQIVDALVERFGDPTERVTASTESFLDLALAHELLVQVA